MVDGGFDPLHGGHIAYFRAARELGRPLLCNLSGDDYVRAKHEPLLPRASVRRSSMPCATSTTCICQRHDRQRARTAAAGRLRQGRGLARSAARPEDGALRGARDRDRLCRHGRGLLVAPAARVPPGQRGSSRESRREGPGTEPRGGRRVAAIDAVVSHHMNPFTSGVAKFNQLLAEELGVPLLSLTDARVADLRPRCSPSSPRSSPARSGTRSSACSTNSPRMSRSGCSSTRSSRRRSSSGCWSAR